MIPQELCNSTQWVGWKYGKSREDGKRPKIPINPRTGKAAKPNDSSTWNSLEMARSAVERYRLEGLGCMFAEGGGYAGVDFDDCIVNGHLVPEAEAAVKALNSYTEISPSGDGVKVWVKGSKPKGAGCVKLGVLGCHRVEVYDSGRFFTVTERHLPSTPETVEMRQAELTALCKELWPEVKTVGKICTPSPSVSQFVVGGSSNDTIHGTADAVERCVRYLETMPDAISGERGHDKAFAVACTCFRFGLSDEQVWQLLVWFSENKSDPKWKPAELQHKLTDAKKKVMEAGEFGKMLRKDKPKREGRPWHNDLPEWIRNLKRPRLRPYQTAILQKIADRCSATPIDEHGSLGGCFIGYEKLADEAGMCPRTAFTHVKKLATMGLLVITETGGWDRVTGEIFANAYAIPGKEGVKIPVKAPNPNLARGSARFTNRHTPRLAYVECTTCIPSATMG